MNGRGGHGQEKFWETVILVIKISSVVYLALSPKKGLSFGKLDSERLLRVGTAHLSENNP